uniref:Uncharacterized protein n=1 Tax=Karlodinium veneficum TaxID=407301 RepID=A7WPX9_KARVE|nr:unknown [Karlodinium veneficum]
MSAAPPTESDLQAKAGGLKKAETKEGSEFDEKSYKAAWDAAGGDCAKITETMGLTETPKDYDSYIALCKAGKFK